MKVVVATRNSGKLEELRNLLPDEFDLLSLDDIDQPSPEETGSTFLENAQIKARSIVELGYAAIADDSGLEVDGLNGDPGIRSARYAGDHGSDEDNNLKLIRALKFDASKPARGARFVSAVVFAAPEGIEVAASGEVRGMIVDDPRGENGFGYDPHFELCDSEAGTFNGWTMAELTLDEKQQISHRARAYRNLRANIAEANLDTNWPAEQPTRINPNEGD